MNKKILVAILLSPSLVLAQEKMIINEQKLKELMTNNVPSIEKINAMVVQSDLDLSQYNQKYSTTVNGQANYNGVDGNVFNGYQGQFEDPARNYGLSVNQNLPVGVNFDVGIYNNFAKTYNYQPGESINSQYGSSLEAKLTVDLWKNLLGYTERAEKLGLKLGQEETKEQAKLETAKFYNEIRKMYWQLSINHSLTKIYETLINQAILQENNVRKMYRASVADRGDLARTTAVVNTRKADLASLQYNIEMLKKELSNLIPELNDKELEFEFGTFDGIQNSIKACFNKIQSQKEVPLNATSYTKIINYKDEKINANLKALKRYSDPNITLEAKASSLGFGKENSDSFEDMSDVERKDYSIGLNVSMPFGSAYSDTKENQMKVLKMQHNAEKKEIMSNLVSYHNYFASSMQKLISVMEDQKAYRDNLTIRVESMRKKYNQGRVSLSELIQDEDSLFESELALVNSYYNIIASMIDYFSVFNDFECDFNLAN